MRHTSFALGSLAALTTAVASFGSRDAHTHAGSQCIAIAPAERGKTNPDSTRVGDKAYPRTEEALKRVYPPPHNMLHFYPGERIVVALGKRRLGTAIFDGCILIPEWAEAIDLPPADAIEAMETYPGRSAPAPFRDPRGYRVLDITKWRRPTGNAKTAGSVPRQTVDTAAILASARPDIDAANAAWVPGLRHRDAQAIVAAYSDSGLFIAVDGTVTRGRAAIAGLYSARFPRMREILDGGVVQGGLTPVSPTLVYEWGSAWIEQAAASPGGQPTRSGGSYLTVWQRERDGHWRIARNLSF